MSKAAAAQQPKTGFSSPSVPRLLQRQCACGNRTVIGGQCAECAKKKSALQRKLTIGASNDPLEQEADRIADQVMSAPTQSTIDRAPLQIQRFAEQAGDESNAAPASVDRVLAGAGRPLEPALREDMEQRFGHDFSHVRVHADTAAEQSARDVNAQAYTVGNNIVFGAGLFALETHSGKRLLAHELTHVMQQSNGNVGDEPRSMEGSALATASSTPQITNGPVSILQREPDSSEKSLAGATSSEMPKKFLSAQSADFSGWTLRLDSVGCPPTASCGLGLKLRPEAGACIAKDCPPLLGSSMMWKVCTYESDGVFSALSYALFMDKNDSKPSFSIGPLCLREKSFPGKPERREPEPPPMMNLPKGTALA